MTEERLGELSPDQGNTDEENNQEESFATLFEQDAKLPGRLDPGQKVTSKVVSISGDFVYVSLGGKSEGVSISPSSRTRRGQPA